LKCEKKKKRVLEHCAQRCRQPLSPNSITSICCGLACRTSPQHLIMLAIHDLPLNDVLIRLRHNYDISCLFYNGVRSGESRRIGSRRINRRLLRKAALVGHNISKFTHNVSFGQFRIQLLQKNPQYVSCCKI